jgi:hypothetical protein
MASVSDKEIYLLKGAKHKAYALLQLFTGNADFSILVKKVDRNIKQCNGIYSEQ